MNVSKRHPSPADERQALEALEARALTQGVLLQGQKSRFQEVYFVVAKCAATGESLNLCLEVTLHLATNPAAFEQAITQLLLQAVAALVPNETHQPVTLQVDSHPPPPPDNGNL